MKTLGEVDALMQIFEGRYGLAIRGGEQLSEAWFNTRLGVITGSNAADAVAKRGTATQLSYMAHLVAQVCTGVRDELSTKHMEWGKEHEKAARSSYEFATKEKIEPVAFVFKNEEFRVGCSPDGFVGGNRLAEIKCPWNSAHYVQFVAEEKLKSDWIWQAQFGLWVTDADEIDVTMFDPRMKTMPLHTIKVERDPKRIEQLNETIPQFIEDMDKMLKRMDVNFGDQWRRIAKFQRESA